MFLSRACAAFSTVNVRTVEEHYQGHNVSDVIGSFQDVVEHCV